MGDLTINTVRLRVLKNEFGYVDPEVANNDGSGGASNVGRRRSISCNAKVEGVFNMLRVGSDQGFDCGGFQEAGTIVATANADSVSVTKLRLETGEVIYVLTYDMPDFTNGCNACCN